MENNRWQCEHCGSLNVEVSYPTWYIERLDYSYEVGECDAEANPLWFYCPDCEECEHPIDRNHTNQKA